jgi:hypothetical protein
MAGNPIADKSYMDAEEITALLVSIIKTSKENL